MTADTVDAAETEAPAKPTGTVLPKIRQINIDDLSAAMRAGVDDFKAYPVYGLFFAAVYALGGIFIWDQFVSNEWSFLAFPAAAGFALIGPFIAVGLYEVSRRREEGEDVSWGVLFTVIRSSGSKSIALLGALLTFVLFIWLEIAFLLYVIIYGGIPGDLLDVISGMATTPSGIMLFVVGNIVGFFFASVVFSISVISFPMLLHRDVDFVTAMLTSINAVRENPRTLAGWAFFIAFLLVVGVLPLFLGLLWVLPVLGHATWHLYRRVVE